MICVSAGNEKFTKKLALIVLSDLRLSCDKELLFLDKNVDLELSLIGISTNSNLNNSRGRKCDW